MKTNFPSFYTQKMENERERCFSFRREGGEKKYFYEDLAKNGFYREPDSEHEDAVRCHFCRIVLYDWNDRQPITEAHIR